MWRRSVVVLALAACGDERTAPVPPAPTPVDAAVVPGAAIKAPHGRPIVAVAVTDDGATAITVDADAGVRLWPRVDGTREPVVVPARPAVELALATHGDGLVAALLDDAGGLEVVRLGTDGAVHGRRLLPPEPGYAEVAAGAVAVLARRSDQRIERIDVRSQLLDPPPGEQVLAIAQRRVSAIAGIADPARPGEIARVREIVIGRDLAWGRAIELPVPLAAPLALSPSGNRIAGISARTGAAVVIELAPTPRILRDERVTRDDSALGFVDDDHAVVRGHVLALSAVSVAGDPWDITRPQLPRIRAATGAAVTDRMIVGGHGTHLVLATTSGATRYLGYRDLGIGFLRVTGEHITLGYGNRVLWLDDRLDATDSEATVNDATGGVAVDEHRLLRAAHAYLDDGRSRMTLSLVDTRTRNEVQLGTWLEATIVAYEPSTRVVAVSGQSAPVPRLQLDPATGSAKPLRSLQARPHSQVELFDPARADGTVAVTMSYGETHMHVETFVDAGKRRVLAPATSVALSPRASSIGFDARGTLYVIDPGARLLGYRGGKQVAKLPIPADSIGGTVRGDGERFAVFSTSSIGVLDATGRERWRSPVWSINAARFSPDGRRLLVNTQGGLVALDTETGERVASGCGWNFGITTEPPPMSIYLAPIVCAEDV